MVAYGGAAKPDIASLASELESTLTNVAVSCSELLAASLLSNGHHKQLCINCKELDTDMHSSSWLLHTSCCFLLVLQIGTHESFQVVVDPRKIGYVSLTDPTSCIRSLTTVRGALVSAGVCVAAVQRA